MTTYDVGKYFEFSGVVLGVVEVGFKHETLYARETQYQKHDVADEAGLGLWDWRLSEWKNMTRDLGAERVRSWSCASATQELFICDH